MNLAYPTPGAVISLRSATWKVLRTSTLKRGFREVHCRGLNGLVRDKEARFVWDLEKGARVLDPAAAQRMFSVMAELGGDELTGGLTELPAGLFWTVE